MGGAPLRSASGPLIQLEEKCPGAPELEKLGRTDCLRLTATVLNSGSPAEVMREVLGVDARDGQSPLALGAGKAFERQLFGDNANLLLAAYRAPGRLDRTDVGVIDIGDAVPAGDPRRTAKRLAATRRLLQEKLRGRSSYAIIIHPLLSLTIDGRQYAVEPDYLVAPARASMYTIGEAKSYYDLGGLTDQADLRNALRQAAVNYLALRETIVGFGLDRAHVRSLVPARVDLALRRVGTRRPSLQNMDIAGELNSVLRAFRTFGDRLAAIHAAVSSAGLVFDLTNPAVIAAIPPTFRSDCREFCGFDRYCRDEAVMSGELTTLGHVAAGHLAAAGNLRRAQELRHGALPRSAEEAALQASLLATEAMLLRSLA